MDPYVAATVEDASLNSLAVHTSDQVWAVGDRGCIWSTLDGGRNWTRQDSGTTVNLHAIAFRDSMNGWAVGGLPGAQTRASRGVVLRTVNGGKTWESLATAALPRLTGLRIVGGKLIAWGDYSVQHRSAILVSMDEGKSWVPMPSSIVHVSALGADPSGSVLAVDRIGNAYNSQLGASRAFFATSPSQPLAFIEHLGNSWLVGGTDGQLMRTIDGQSWSRVSMPLSPPAQQVCHWRAATVVDDHVWVVGTPGSIVMHSDNRGLSWETLTTDQTLPLRAIAFADRQRGWAVGSLGLILATRDGGRTWYTQHKTAVKLGLLAITARGTQTPWGALVATSWDNSIAAGAIAVFGQELAQSADYRVESWTCRNALAPQLGLADYQSWQLPETSTNPTVAPADAAPSQLSDAQLKDKLANRLLVELCSWRPDVVLTDETGDGKLTELNREVILSVTGAMEAAAQAIPTTICSELHLPKWRVSKLAAVTDSRTAQYTEQLSRLLREPGLSICDILQPLGTGYLNVSPSASQQIAMRTLQHVQTTAATTSSLMGGIAPSAASHIPTKRNLGNYQLIMGRVHRISSLETIANMPSEMPISEWQSQLDFVLQTLPPREIPSMLMRVAEICSAPQQWTRRRLALERLAQLQPDSDAATAARLKVLELRCSDELLAWAQRSASSNTQLVNELRNNPRSLNATDSSPRSPFDALVVPASASASASQKTTQGLAVESGAQFASVQTAGNGVTTASYEVENRQVASVTGALASSTVAGGANPSRDVAEHCQDFFTTLDACTKSDPLLMEWPELKTMYQAMNRAKAETQPGTSPSTTALEQLKSLSALAGWPQIAQQELVLAAGHADQLRWATLAMATAQPPQLDGVLDEPLWRACPPMQLTGIDAGNDTDRVNASTMLRWAYDDQYLYIAIDSPRTIASIPKRINATRQYDSDLRLADHLQLLLDTDRDYASAVELGVSAAGETYDQVCGIASYNPKWFVAVSEAPDKQHWKAEIAIRLTDLTTRTDLAGRAWAISAHRRSPTGQDQSWSLLRTHEPSLQSAGLMLFLPPMPEN